MILFWLGTCNHTPTLHKNAEKPTVMGFLTQILIESTVNEEDVSFDCVVDAERQRTINDVNDNVGHRSRNVEIMVL